MVPPIVVGAHPKRYEPEPVALGLMFSRLTQAPLHVVGTFWFDETPQRTASEDYGRILKDAVQDELERSGGDWDDALPRVRFEIEHGPDRYAIHRAASRVGAGLIVIGSTHHGPVERLLPGTTPAGVLRRPPCPVAVAPRGLGDELRAPERVGVLVRGPGACAALQAAATIARHTGGGLVAYSDHDHAEPEVRRAIAEHAGDIDFDVRALPRGGLDALALESREFDLLVAGSRVARLRRKLGRRLSCPLVVVPEEVDQPLVELFGEVPEHARAEGAWVRLELERGCLIVEVGENGAGGATAPNGGAGLAGLADRIGPMNGDLTVTSPPGEGTTLRAKIPLD